MVTVTGGILAPGGVAATAVANIDYSTHQVTGITITSPGNYTDTTGVSAAFTGGGATAVIPTGGNNQLRGKCQWGTDEDW